MSNSRFLAAVVAVAPGQIRTFREVRIDTRSIPTTSFEVRVEAVEEPSAATSGDLAKAPA